MSQTASIPDYDYSVAKAFTISTLVWGAIGMSVGLTIALELVFPQLNADLPWLSFNRLRPLHTNAVIFGFTLAGVFATWYYVSQRVLKVRMVLPAVGKFHVILFNLIIILAAYTLLAGHTSSKEYHELPWWLDILVVIMWLTWGVHIFAMLGARKEKTLYVSIWYYVACFIAVSMLYLINGLAIPTWFVTQTGNWWHSVSMFAEQTTHRFSGGLDTMRWLLYLQYRSSRFPTISFLNKPTSRFILIDSPSGHSGV